MKGDGWTVGLLATLGSSWSLRVGAPVSAPQNEPEAGQCVHEYPAVLAELI